MSWLTRALNPFQRPSLDPLGIMGGGGNNNRPQYQGNSLGRLGGMGGYRPSAERYGFEQAENEYQYPQQDMSIGVPSAQMMGKGGMPAFEQPFQQPGYMPQQAPVQGNASSYQQFQNPQQWGQNPQTWGQGEQPHYYPQQRMNLLMRR